VSGALAGLALVAAGADASAVLRALEQAGSRLRTMQASFVETKVLVLLGETQESRGKVFLEVPGRFRWSYEAPQPSVMLVKDGRYARFFPKSKQVFRGAARGEADLLVGFGPGAADLGNRYAVALVGEEAVGAAPTHVLDLTSRSGQSALFSAIRMWVDKSRHVPLQTRLTEPTGDHTTVRFDGVIVNGRLPPGTFELRLPGDVVEVE
jgi:outer membrane lipoprotein-sorting protein